MEDFIQWIVDNWQFVSSVGLSIFSLILLLVFKKKPTNIYYDQYYEDLIQLINEAERLFNKPNEGKLKQQYVLQKTLLRHPEVEPQAVIFGIDNVLSAPSKKGGK